MLTALLLAPLALPIVTLPLKKLAPLLIVRLLPVLLAPAPIVTVPTLVRVALLIVSELNDWAEPTVKALEFRFHTPPWPAALRLLTKPVVLESIVMPVAVNSLPPAFRIIVPLVPLQVKLVIPATTPPLSISNRPPLPSLKMVLVRPVPLLVTTSHTSPRAFEIARRLTELANALSRMLV